MSELKKRLLNDYIKRLSAGIEDTIKIHKAKKNMQVDVRIFLLFIFLRKLKKKFNIETYISACHSRWIGTKHLFLIYN